jgi:hypothetical protein
MKKKKVYLYKMPDGSPYIIRERSFHTSYKQNAQTGRMIGRKHSGGVGDKTGVRRVKRDFVLVKKSDRAKGHTRKVPYQEGMIVGRY